MNKKQESKDQKDVSEAKQEHTEAIVRLIEDLQKLKVEQKDIRIARQAISHRSGY